MEKRESLTSVEGSKPHSIRTGGLGAETHSDGPAKNVRRVKGLADLRRAYRCPSCDVQGRPLKRVWGVERQVAAHPRSGYVKYMGPDWDVDADPYECRHCGEPWWVWDRYERMVEVEEVDTSPVVCGPSVA